MQHFEICEAGNHLNTYVTQVRDRLLVSKLVTKLLCTDTESVM
jgi:hypothetical protein